MSSPALPWANLAPETEQDQAPAQNEQTTAPANRDKSEVITLEAAGVAVDGRVEVGTEMLQWWGATIVGPSKKQDLGPGVPVYELLYDAYGDFEQERGHVIFTSEHTLRQLDQKEELSWRREGDTWGEEEEDGDDASEESEDGEAAGSDVLLSVDDLRKISEEGLNGRSLEEVEAEVLQSLEPSTRIAMAAGFREFTDNLVSFLQDQSAESGVVTAEHVRAFMETMRNKKQRTS